MERMCVKDSGLVVVTDTVTADEPGCEGGDMVRLLAKLQTQLLENQEEQAKLSARLISIQVTSLSNIDVIS